VSPPEALLCTLSPVTKGYESLLLLYSLFFLINSSSSSALYVFVVDVPINVFKISSSRINYDDGFQIWKKRKK